MHSFTKLSVLVPLLLSFLLLSPFHSSAAPVSKPKTPPVPKPKTPPVSKPKTPPVPTPKTPPVSKPNTNGSELLDKACSRMDDKPFCMNYLKTNAKIMAATKSKPLDFALTLIQHAGVDEAKNIHAYLSKPRGKLAPQAIAAYNSCKTYWEGLASGLERSIKNLREFGGYADDTMDYDLKVNLDKATNCGTALNNAKIQDPVIAKGNTKVTIAVMGADAILEGVKPPKKLD